MTVNTTNITSGPYVGNGLSDQYSYTFRVQDKTQLKVFETTDEGVRTQLAVDTDYTVAGIGNDAGGIITRVAGNLPTDYQWYIRSNYKLTQLTAFASQGGFFPNVHEDVSDKLTFLAQQQEDILSRTFRLSNEVDIDGDFIIDDDVANRAGKHLSFDIVGNLQVSSAPQVLTVDGIYDNVALMKADSLATGLFIQTRGYYAAGDKGAATYLIVAPQSFDGYGNHELANGNIAVLQTGTVVNIRQFGASPTATASVNVAAIQATQNYVHAIGGGVIYGPNGEYDINDTIAWKNKVSILGETMYGFVLNQLDATKATLKPDIPAGSGGGFTANMGINMNLKNIWIKYSSVGADRYNYTGAIGIDINGVILRQFIWEDIEVYACHTGLRVDNGGSFFGGSINGFRVRNSYRGFHKTNTGGWITSLEAKFQFDQCFHGLYVTQCTYCTFELNHDSGGLGATSLPYGPSNEMPINAAFTTAKGIIIKTLGVENNNAIQLYLRGGSQVNILSYFTTFSPANTWTKDAARVNNIALAEQAVFSIQDGSLEMGSIEYIARTANGYPAATTTDSNFFYVNTLALDPCSLTLRSGLIDVDSYYWGDTTTFLTLSGLLVYSPQISVDAFRRIRAYDRTAAAQRSLHSQLALATSIQTWQTVTRTSGTTYYNTTGSSIAIVVTVNSASTVNIITVDGLEATKGHPISGSIGATFSTVIPPNSAYVVTATSIVYVRELR